MKVFSFNLKTFSISFKTNPTIKMFVIGIHIFLPPEEKGLLFWMIFILNIYKIV